jgi:hypothetical protein
MRSPDENCRQGKKKGTKLVFLLKLVLRGVSPPVLDLPYLRLECWLVFIIKFIIKFDGLAKIKSCQSSALTPLS